MITIQDGNAHFGGITVPLDKFEPLFKQFVLAFKKAPTTEDGELNYVGIEFELYSAVSRLSARKHELDELRKGRYPSGLPLNVDAD